MPDHGLPVPEPNEVDEQKNRELSNLREQAVLRGQPYGDERCGSCRYYLDGDDDISYCWQPKVRILVGADWWCQHWEGSSD